MGPNPGTHPLTFSAVGSRQAQHVSDYAASLSCETLFLQQHGQQAAGTFVSTFLFPRPSCCRHPSPPPVFLCRSCKAEQDMGQFLKKKKDLYPVEKFGPQNTTLLSFSNSLLHITAPRRPHPQRQPQSNIPDGCSFGLLRIPGSFTFLLTTKKC